MTFKEAVEATPGLDQAFRTGLQALRAKDRPHVDAEDPRSISGSADIDTALQNAHPNANRWDYAVAYKHQNRAADVVYWLEPHTANDAEVSRLVRATGSGPDTPVALRPSSAPGAQVSALAGACRLASRAVRICRSGAGNARPPAAPNGTAPRAVEAARPAGVEPAHIRRRLTSGAVAARAGTTARGGLRRPRSARPGCCC